MSTYEKLTSLFLSSIYLVFSSLEMQRNFKCRTDYKFLLCLKSNVSQTFESSSCKKLFAKCVFVGKACFDKGFLFHVIIGRHSFL